MFFSHFKWSSSQDQQKTNGRRLIIYKVTFTGPLFVSVETREHGDVWLGVQL